MYAGAGALVSLNRFYGQYELQAPPSAPPPPASLRHKTRMLRKYAYYVPARGARASASRLARPSPRVSPSARRARLSPRRCRA